MVSTIERFHCIQDSQVGPNCVHYREVPLYTGQPAGSQWLPLCSTHNHIINSLNFTVKFWSHTRLWSVCFNISDTVCILIVDRLRPLTVTLHKVVVTLASEKQH